MNATADSLLYWLGRTSLEASLLIGMVLLLRWSLGHRLTPGWRVALWAAVALKCLVPAVLPTGVGLGMFWNTDSRVAPTAAVIMEAQTAAVAIPMPLETAVDPVVNSPLSVLTILLGVWLAGVVMVIGLAVWRQWKFSRVVAQMTPCHDASLQSRISALAKTVGLRITPQIRFSDDAVVPSVFGLFHPTLLLPRDWALEDGAGAEQVLRHELTHLRRHDILWNWAGVVLQSLHWFNPFVWLAASRCQEDRELACDDCVLAAARQADRFAYGRELLRLQEAFSAPPALAGLAACVRNHPTLHQRILMITQPVVYRPWLQVACTAVLAAIVCLSFGSSASAQDEKAATRTREGERSRAGGESGERSRNDKTAKVGEEMGKKAGAEGEGNRKRGGEADGGKKAGPRDGDGAKQGMRDGEGARKRGGEGDGAAKTGPRDGEGGGRKGMRDGEGAARSAERDGEGRKGRGESGERGKSAEGGKSAESGAAGEKIVLRVVSGGDEVMVGKEKMPVNRLRGYLSEFLPEHAGAAVVVQADDDVPFKAVAGVLDAARDNGAKKAVIENAPKGE